MDRISEWLGTYTHSLVLSSTVEWSQCAEDPRDESNLGGGSELEGKGK